MCAFGGFLLYFLLAYAFLTIASLCNMVRRGSAAGPSGTTYEHVVPALKGSDRALELGVQFINLLLSGALPRCDSPPHRSVQTLARCPSLAGTHATCTVTSSSSGSRGRTLTNLQC